MAELAPLPDDRRAAYYVCTAAVADPAGNVHSVVEGCCHGIIIKNERGTGGFGYDPLFWSDELGKTFGEATAEEKDAVSHRGRALRTLAETLRQR